MQSPNRPPLPFSVSATRAATGAGTQMILGPLDTQDLTPADRDGLVGLVRQARLFDLPATLPAPEAEPDGPPTQPREDASESPGDAITIVVRTGARTAEVSYFPALSPRPPELDNISAAWRTARPGVPRMLTYPHRHPDRRHPSPSWKNDRKSLLSFPLPRRSRNHLRRNPGLRLLIP